MDDILCSEKYGSTRSFKNISFNKFCINTNIIVLKQQCKWNHFSSIIRSIFLPQGYPDSVSEDYLDYQIWDTVQAFASSITGTLATHAVLQGVGVGDENSTVIAATVTWLLKSGAGMIGQIMFTWIQGTFLDSDCKKWRIFADILNDFAIFLEILAPAFNWAFRFITCTAGVCKALVGVAGGATRAALTQHQARRNNMADVSAKDGSQETLVNLVALICSLIIMPIVSKKTSLIWLLYIAFTSLHIFANFRAVSTVCIDVFNLSRLHIVLQNRFEFPESSLMSKKLANRLEPVIFNLRKCYKIKLGVSVEHIFKSFNEFKNLCELYKDKNYILKIDPKKSEIHIAFSEDSTKEDQLEACFQAEALQYVMKHYKKSAVLLGNFHLNALLQAIIHRDFHSMMLFSLNYTNDKFQKFQKDAAMAGWNLDYMQLGIDEWRYHWPKSTVI